MRDRRMVYALGRRRPQPPGGFCPKPLCGIVYIQQSPRNDEAPAAAPLCMGM